MEEDPCRRQLTLEKTLFPEIDSLFKQAEEDRNSVLAACGSCRVNKELLRYCSKKYYPYCRCIRYVQTYVIKTAEGEKSNEGEQVPEDARFPVDHPEDDRIVCPKGFRFYYKNKYDLLRKDNRYSDLELTLKLNRKYRKKFHDIISVRGRVSSLFLNEEVNNYRRKLSNFLILCKWDFEDIYATWMETPEDIENIMEFEWLYVDD